MDCQSKQVLRFCPVCGSTDAGFLFHHTLTLIEGHPLPNEYKLAICRCCGLGYQQNVGEKTAYDKYYKHLSKYATSFSPLTEADKFSSLATVLQRFFPNKQTSILDVGCGAGAFLAKLQQIGYTNLSGMDPNPLCVETVSRSLGIDVRTGILSAPPFPLASFDLVISTGVLEHLVDPAHDLYSFSKLLALGGAVFVVVPDASRYVDFLDAPFQDFNIEHINHFSLKTLDTLFAKQGWSSVALGQDVSIQTDKWSEPILWGLFKQASAINTQYEHINYVNYDADLETRLKSYISNSYILLDKIDSQLRRALAGVSQILLWGVGQTSSLLLSSTVIGEMNIHAVVDNNPAYAGTCLAGAPVGGPEIKGNFAGPIVVASIRQGAAVKNFIRSALGWSNPIIMLDIK